VTSGSGQRIRHLLLLLLLLDASHCDTAPFLLADSVERKKPDNLNFLLLSVRASFCSLRVFFRSFVCVFPPPFSALGLRQISLRFASHTIDSTEQLAPTLICSFIPKSLSSEEALVYSEYPLRNDGLVCAGENSLGNARTRTGVTSRGLLDCLLSAMVELFHPRPTLWLFTG
jgi:hypothetical protein